MICRSSLWCDSFRDNKKKEEIALNKKRDLVCESDIDKDEHVGERIQTVTDGCGVDTDL
jgi:hypothetical protein